MRPARPRHDLLAVLLLAVATAACAAPAGTRATPVDPPPAGTWTLTAFLEHDARPVPPPTLEVGADGALSGDAGCNGYTGLWSPAPTLGPFAATRRLCAPEIMDVERRFLDTLSRVAGWRVDGDRLWLVDAEGRDLLAFARVGD